MLIGSGKYKKVKKRNKKKYMNSNSITLFCSGAWQTSPRTPPEKKIRKQFFSKGVIQQRQT
jgi:hypothetical protein